MQSMHILVSSLALFGHEMHIESKDTYKKILLKQRPSHYIKEILVVAATLIESKGVTDKRNLEKALLMSQSSLPTTPTSELKHTSLN